MILYIRQINKQIDSRKTERETIKMKEFKFYSNGFELPVSVCETQKEAVYEITSAREALKLLDKEGECGCEKLIIDVIYKDGSTYYNSNNYAEEGKFKRTGIARAMVSTEYGTAVFGDFAITEYGDVSIDESDIEEYGVYAGQYDVKEQTEETVESVEETTVAEKFIIYVSDDDLNVFCAKVFVGTVKELDDECDRIIAETNCEEYLHVLCYTDKRWEWVQKHYNQVSKSALSVVVRKTETAEQETELNTEVETEQTENNAESVSETYGVDVKVDTSKSNELSGTTKTLMALSPVVSEYLRQIEYIDTS